MTLSHDDGVVSGRTSRKVSCTGVEEEIDNDNWDVVVVVVLSTADESQIDVSVILPTHVGTAKACAVLMHDKSAKRYATQWRGGACRRIFVCAVVENSIIQKK